MHSSVPEFASLSSHISSDDEIVFLFQKVEPGDPVFFFRLDVIFQHFQPSFKDVKWF